jgi:CheY-like chemotaxis protein
VNSKDQRAVRAALAGARLLLVEDNEINQQVARELLEQVNITVLLAENGRQAVDMMATERLDGVLMDLYMPIMDGLTATRRIRSNPRFDRIPIIAMTANAMAGDRDACLEVGMQDHIAKPIDPDEMFATLGRWVTPEHLQATPQTIQPATVPPEPDTDAVPDMAGIDVQAGLRRMGGSPQVYRSILTKFRLNQGESVAAVRAALLSARQGDAERYAHTLKGVAATIGAMALHEQAWELEQQVKSGVTLERLGPCLDRTEAALQQICTVIDGALSGKAVLTPAIPIPLGMETPASIGERDRLFRAVHAQLSSFDAEAGATLESLQQLPLAPEMRTWIDRMAHNVAQYDFEVAMEQLQHVCQLFSIDCRE